METISVSADLIKIVAVGITLSFASLAVYYIYWAGQSEEGQQERNLTIPAIAFTMITIFLLVLTITIIFGPPSPGTYR